MPPFSGQLNANEIFAALFNMIISQQTFADNIAGGSPKLVGAAKVDGSMNGDTKLYYSTDALEVDDWGADAEAANLLALHRPPAPKCQAIVINQKKQISLTVDNYLSKRAWMDEGSFGTFTSVMLQWIGDTKRVYDEKTYNAFLGTAETSIGSQMAQINLTTAIGEATGEEANRLEAQAISQGLADIVDNMTLDATGDYNDYGYLRSIARDSLRVIWNNAWVNKITKLDLPTIFHKDIISMSEKLPSKFFGTVNSDAKQGNGTTIRSLIDQKITTGTGQQATTTHYRAGDLIKTTDTAPAGTSYTVNPKVICKIVTVLPPYMSGFQVGTSFFNGKSLTENHYLTFMHNTLEYLKGKPLVTVKRD